MASLQLQHAAGPTRAPGVSAGTTQGNIVQLGCVYAIIIADIIVTAYTDPLQSTAVLTHLLLLGLQLFLLLATVLAYFLLTTSLCSYVQVGLYDKYFKQHCGVYAVSLAAVILVASTGAYRLVLLYKQSPYLTVWQQPGYIVVWMLQRLCLLVLYCYGAYATARSLAHHKQPWPTSAATHMMI